MSINNCEKCGERFKVTETGGGQPHKPESEDIKCPYCGHQTWENSTGYFHTERVPRK